MVLLSESYSTIIIGIVTKRRDLSRIVVITERRSFHLYAARTMLRRERVLQCHVMNASVNVVY